ncbi:hypothetical protein BJ741DRAFT_599120 [Chytriomyces cf. hyalinus JEL632]|nr:hypothetical protein BJ741DRAFT_599120 [Chytriomyces cf. hyalinus JEL632]
MKLLSLVLFALVAKSVPVPTIFDEFVAAFGNAAKQLLDQGNSAQTGEPINTKSPAYSVLFAPANPKDSTDAFSNFANHVYGVSATILGLSTAIGAEQIAALGNIGYAHEALESIEAMKMASNAAPGSLALQALVDNTPCILNGMQSAIQTPTAENAVLVAQQMSTVRDAYILPNILALGKESGARNLLELTPTGPILGQGSVAVQAAGSALLLDAQRALGCSSVSS